MLTLHNNLHNSSVNHFNPFIDYVPHLECPISECPKNMVLILCWHGAIIQKMPEVWVLLAEATPNCPFLCVSWTPPLGYKFIFNVECPNPGPNLPQHWTPFHFSSGSHPQRCARGKSSRPPGENKKFVAKSTTTPHHANLVWYGTTANLASSRRRPPIPALSVASPDTPEAAAVVVVIVVAAAAAAREPCHAAREPVSHDTHVTTPAHIMLPTATTHQHSRCIPRAP